MRLYPAIDLKEGKCVRLVHGDMKKVTIFNDSPANQAKSFEDQGAEYIHVVDLNGAFEGKPVNLDAVKEILAAVNVPVQLGGGIRSMETIDAWIDAGVARVILGTVALKNPELVRKACKKYAGKIVVGIDAVDGMVATEGWADVSKMKVLDLAQNFENAGVTAIVFTDVGRDGAMQGPNTEAIVALAKEISIPVIASGGVSSNEDLKTLRDAEKFGVEGVISGRAIYDGEIDVKNAVEILKG